MSEKEVDMVAEIIDKAINSDNDDFFASVCRLLTTGLVILAKTSSDEFSRERFVQIVVNQMRNELGITQKAIKQFQE